MSKRTHNGQGLAEVYNTKCIKTMYTILIVTGLAVFTYINTVYYMKRRAVSLRQRSFLYLIRLLPPVPEQLCAKLVKRITTTKSTLFGNIRRSELQSY